MNVFRKALQIVQNRGFPPFSAVCMSRGVIKIPCNIAYCINYGISSGFSLPPLVKHNGFKITLWFYFQIFHFGTAQQVGNKIEFSAVCLDTNFDMTFDNEVWLANASVSPGLAYSFTIDLASKCCTRTQIDRACVEFPSTHPYRHGMSGTRYNYFMACDRPGFNLPYRDVVKVRPLCQPNWTSRATRLFFANNGGRV